jgi:hypothetical protein
MTTFFTIIPVAIGLLVVIRFFIHINEKEEWVEKIPGNGQEKQGQTCYKSRSLQVERSILKSDYFDSCNKIDIKEAIALAVTIVSLLPVLTLLNLLETVLKQPREATTNEQSVQSTANNPTLQVLPFIVLWAISFGAFISNERESKFPLVNFNLMLNRAILPANLIIVLVGFSMFMLFQTIPILVKIQNL